jgi:hypothetical protein
MAQPNPNPRAGLDLHDANQANLPAQHNMADAMANFANQFLATIPAMGTALAGNAALTDQERTDIMAPFNATARAAQRIRDSALVTADRNKSEEEVPIASSLPTLGNTIAIPDLRNLKLTTFTGDTGKEGRQAVDCIQWLDRVLRVASTHTLTEITVIHLIEMHTGGSAAQTMYNSVRENLSLTGVIRALEIRFADLMQPDQARQLVNSLARTPGETLGQLSDRIRRLAFMATRLDQADVKLDNEITLATVNFLRCLPPRVKDDVENLTKNRRIGGLKPLDYSSLLAVSEQYERRKSGRQSQGIHFLGRDDGLETTSAITTQDIPDNITEMVQVLQQMGFGPKKPDQKDQQRPRDRDHSNGRRYEGR